MKCEIIKDLLPVYCDGLASEETRSEVEAHLAECEECRNHLKLMKESVPEVPKPDIQPMKKIKRSLRLRLALVIGMVCIGLFAGLYNMLVANPMTISSKNVSVRHFAGRQGEKLYMCNIDIRGQKREVGCTIRSNEEYIIDEQNNCVWVDGEKLVAAEIDGENIYAPADGKMYEYGVLTVVIECKTPFKCMQYECTPIYNPFMAAEQELTLRPCLPFRQDVTKALFDTRSFAQEYAATSLGEGSTMTIHCRDKDVIIDLHELAVEEGLLSE